MYAKPKSAPPFSLVLWMWTSGVIESISFSVSSGVSGGPSIGVMLPLSRSVGGCPTCRWRSEAFCSKTSSSSSFIS